MRILYFSRDYTSHDYRFLSALAKTGHEIYYLRLERRGHTLEDRSLPPEVSQVHWAGGNAPAGWRDGPRLLASLKKVIRQVRPDLIQAGPIQTAAFLVALSGYRPLVSMSWGYDLLKDAGRSRLWGWATRFTLKRSAAFVGDCDTIRRRAVSFGMREGGIVTFPWGVDLSHFTPQDPVSEDPPGPVTLLSTRGWEPIYGVDVIARAFASAAVHQANCGGPELRLIMLGNGSQAGLLRQIFTQGGVIDQVSFPGQVGYSDLPR
ncbi:MAG: hypothetical protein EHM70_25620, partial [Chloroflexota bacterium]